MTTSHSATLTSDLQELKLAFRALARAYGGQDAAAARLGTRQQRVSECGLPNCATFARIDEVAALEDATAGHPGHPHVTAALARRQGFALVREPDAPPDDADMLGLIAALAKEGGEVMSAMADAVADRRIDLAEAEKIEAEAQHVVEVGMRIRAIAAAARRDGGRAL